MDFEVQAHKHIPTYCCCYTNVNLKRNKTLKTAVLENQAYWTILYQVAKYLFGMIRHIGKLCTKDKNSSYVTVSK
jgi:hypothetical protein